MSRFNQTLFVSRHAVVAALVVAGFAVWLIVIGARIGARTGSNPGYVLWSGWTAAVLMWITALYSVRKYMHKLGIAPDVERPVTVKDVQAVARQMERTEERLNDVRNLIARKALVTRAEIAARIDRVLAEERLTRRFRVVIEPPDARQPQFTFRLAPREPLGRMSRWLNSHVWYGTAAGALVVFHGGTSPASPLGVLLAVLTLVVIVTGILGIFLFALGPAWITAREKDVTSEEGFILRRHYQEKIGGLLAGATLSDRVKSQLQAVRKGTRKPTEALYAAIQFDATERESVQDGLVLLAQEAQVLASWRPLATIRFWMNAWRLVHIPASILLLMVILVHIFAVTWY